jgi:hypothetical protein
MLSIALYVGMCCHTVAPHLIKPGMTSTQVEAILGKISFCSMYGPLHQSSICACYANHMTTIWYDEHQNGEWIVERVHAIKLASANFTNSDQHK